MPFLCQVTQPEMCQLEMFLKAKETTVQKGRNGWAASFNWALTMGQACIKGSMCIFLFQSHYEQCEAGINLIHILWKILLRLRERNLSAFGHTGSRHKSQESHSKLFNSEDFHHSKLPFKGNKECGRIPPSVARSLMTYTKAWTSEEEGHEKLKELANFFHWCFGFHPDSLPRACGVG